MARGGTAEAVPIHRTMAYGGTVEAVPFHRTIYESRDHETKGTKKAPILVVADRGFGGASVLVKSASWAVP